MGRIRTDFREWSGNTTDEFGEAALRRAYENGWQPGDVLHAARRGLVSLDVPPVGLLILREANRSGAWARAPLHWADQLRAIAEAHPRHATEPHLPEAAVRLLGGLAPLRRLCPPPSQWPDVRAEQQSDVPDAKILGRIRGLLAKAERTEFAEEAEIFTAKAQELMTRHCVTAALLDADLPVTVQARRIHLDRPYSKQKGLLLTTVGDANHVRTLYNPADAIATVVGTPLALDQVDVLFTSLLVQATRAMHTERARGATSPAFRRAFLYGFAVRIGQRLTEADKSATAQAVVDAEAEFRDLLPILTRRSQAVEAEVDRLFGSALRSWSVTAGDRAGLTAGRSAADSAQLRQDRAVAG